MDLFIMTNGFAHPSVHALLIEPFKSMWENDTDVDKANVLKDFTYIELVCSPKKSNPFSGVMESDRPKQVKKEVYGSEQHNLTSAVVLATMRYKELLIIASPGYELYESALVAAKNLEVYLRSMDLAERTPAGGMVIKPKEITAALKEIPDVINSLQQNRNKVTGELQEDFKMRNEREINLYEE